MNPENIKGMLQSGTVKQATVDASILRMLTPMFAVGVMDAPAGTWDWSKLKVPSTQTPPHCNAL